MPSYWRNFFGGQPTTSSSSSSHSKSHHRSGSTPSAPSVGYIYAVPGSTPSTSSSLGSRKRSNSYLGSRTTPPSPLRYSAYDSSSTRQQSHVQVQAQTPLSRPQLYRTMSHERPAPYPLYTPSVSFSSSRSNSSSSLYPGSSSSHPTTAPPRTSSSGSVNIKQPEVRPILKQNHTWHGQCTADASHAHVSFKNVPPPTKSFQMHSLLACSRLHNAPISYDVTYTPSSRSVTDRGTHLAVPASTLSQPATEPPTSSRLVLKADKLPWPIIVSPGHTSSKAKSAPRFYIQGSSASKQSEPTHVSNLDILYALHTTLAARITQEEWEQLGHGSRAQRKITRAYEKRCVKMGGGWEGGVRRLDWLGGKTRLVGIEMDKSAGGVGRLIFAKA